MTVGRLPGVFQVRLPTNDNQDPQTRMMLGLGQHQSMHVDFSRMQMKSDIATWEALKNPHSKNTSKSPAATGLGFELENLTQWGTRLRQSTSSNLEAMVWRLVLSFRFEFPNIFDFWLTTP